MLPITTHRTTKMNETTMKNSKALLISEYTDQSHPAVLLLPSQKPSIQKVTPNTELIQKLTTFLPQLQKANEATLLSMTTSPSSSTSSSSIHIEALSDLIEEIQDTILENNNVSEKEKESDTEKNEETYVSMKLGLGLFDVLPPSSEPAHSLNTTSLSTSNSEFEQALLSFLQVPLTDSTSRSTSSLLTNEEESDSEMESSSDTDSSLSSSTLSSSDGEKHDHEDDKEEEEEVGKEADPMVT